MRRNTLALWLCLMLVTMPMLGFTYDDDTLSTSVDLSTGARGADDGCTDSNAVNYNTGATNDDGSCKYQPELLAPVGGEEWEVGSTQEIGWQATGWSVVSLYYSNDVGDSWIYIITTENTGVYGWTVPDAPNSMAMVRIAVDGVDGDGDNKTWDDTNNATFTINSGPNNGTNPCDKFVIEANGYVGPEWNEPGAANTPYTIDDIVEWPSGSGQFWMSNSFNNFGEPGVSTTWTGPCACEDIWNYTQTVWNSGDVYGLYEIVEFDGNLYYSLLVNNTNTPGVGDTWVLCGNISSDIDCQEGFNGYGGPVWASGVSSQLGDIIEYPAGSGEFYIALHSAVDPSAPDGWNGYEFWAGYCNCTEIWMAHVQAVWSSSQSYNAWYIVEWPVGSNVLWMASKDNYGDEPGTSDNWTRCGEEQPSGGGGPCSDFNGTGGPAWVVGSAANIGDIYEYPVGSGEFYMVVAGGGGQLPTPGSGDVWSEPCNCTEIWLSNNQPMWDSSWLGNSNPANPYDAWYIVGFGSTLYISEMDNNPMQPDTTRWRVCDPFTCEDASGPWPHWKNPQWTGAGYSIGDQVNFGNGLYISVINNNTIWPNQYTAPAWIECNCSELTYTSWTNQSNYVPGDVVIDSDGIYWIALANNTGLPPDPYVTTTDESGNEVLAWRPCDYCKLSDSHIDGPWNQGVAGATGYDYGEIREYSGSFFISILDNNHQEPTTDIMWISFGHWKFQLPIFSQGWVECNCSEIANGNVYQSGQVYAEGDVVIGPDGEIWISMYNNNKWWPGIVFVFSGLWGNPPLKVVFPTWERCNPTDACGDDVPVWNPATGAASGYVAGDTVQWPANTNHKWRLQVTGSTDIPAFTTDWHHCKMMSSDWPDHSKALPPNLGQVILQEPQDMAKCDARAVDASGLPALEAEDADYLCAAELSYSVGVLSTDSDTDTAEDSTEGRASGRARYRMCTLDGSCCGGWTDTVNDAIDSFQRACQGKPSIADGDDWSYELQEDGSLRGTANLPGVTCASPILSDLGAEYTCTDNIALQLKKEWTAVSMNTLNTTFAYSYPLLDDCRLITDQPDMLCGSMTYSNSSMMIGDEEHRVIYLDPGGTSIIGYYSGDPLSLSCECGVTTWCNAPRVCVEPSCNCVLPKDKDDGGDGYDMMIHLVSSVYEDIVDVVDLDNDGDGVGGVDEVADKGGVDITGGGDVVDLVVVGGASVLAGIGLSTMLGRRPSGPKALGKDYNTTRSNRDSK